MQNSPSKIRVLTPQVEIQGNKYLSCLWMAVQKFAVEVDTFSTDKDNKYDLTQVRAGRKIGNIIHIHWINGFCNFKDYSGNIWISRVGTLFLSLKNLLALSLLKLKGYKIVWTIHNSISHGSKVMLRERLFRRGLSSLCSDILVMSEYSRQQFSQIYGRTHRVHIVPHGNYIGAYPNEISLADARNKLDIPVDAKVFLHIGLIRGYKGINDLIDAFKQIDDNNCFLLIAGACLDADLRQEIELAAKNDDRVRLHGRARLWTFSALDR
ncbi:MAG: glycosyltransferase family 4 protein, partial [Leptolyngbyaceae cyanobacterium RM2_2_4]|nr:glycosyltransferase family 4 protein [Leptolyngbyaceae cyanobacterium RM2_2_4]